MSATRVSDEAQNQRLADIIWTLLDQAREPGEELPIGEWWDVVATTHWPIGAEALNRMGRAQPGGCGPVIADPERNLLYWLVPPRTIRTWTNESGLCFSSPCLMTIPPLSKLRAPGAYWARPLQEGRLVDAVRLDALLTALRPQLPHIETVQGAITCLVP